ncbi:hypothetical protein T484DRAFT_2742239 [Baffinella frigidus]|nr:hypothetical protein T484DRAFT_2742239 [Cryptophyta sp. CCMP2293]
MKGHLASSIGSLVLPTRLSCLLHRLCEAQNLESHESAETPGSGLLSGPQGPWMKKRIADRRSVERDGRPGGAGWCPVVKGWGSVPGERDALPARSLLKRGVV